MSPKISSSKVRRGTVRLFLACLVERKNLLSKRVSFSQKRCAVARRCNSKTQNRKSQMNPQQNLLDLPAPELLNQAAQARDAAFGNRLTYSPKVFIPLTMLCRDRCGYCTFAQPPARLTSPFLSLDEVIAIAAKGAEAGCHEALFTLGERPELRYPDAADWLKEHGYESTVDLPLRHSHCRARRNRPAPPRQRRRALPRRDGKIARNLSVSGDDAGDLEP